MNAKWMSGICLDGVRRGPVSKVLLALPLLGLSTVAFAADLALDFQDSPNIGPAGGVFTYSLGLQNNGPAAEGSATGITTSFSMPVTGGGTYGQFLTYRVVDGTGTCTYNVGPQTVTCNGLSTLAFNQAMMIEIDVRLPSAGSYNSNASAASIGATADTNLGNNSAPQTTTAQAASDLQLNASSNAAPGILAGQPYAYQLDVTNNGPDAMPANSGTRVTFQIPSGASVTGRPSGSGWTCTPDTGYPLSNNELITCDRNQALANGATAPVITVPAVSNTNGNVSASFRVAGLQQNGEPVPDGNETNNIDSVPLTFEPGTDVSVVKARTTPTGTGAVAQGSTVTYTLTPSHLGGQQPGGTITVTDTLGAGLSFAAPTAFTAGSGWSCGTIGNVLTCTRSGWNGGNFSNMPTIQVHAVANDLGTLENTAEITTPGDANFSNNISTVNINSSNEADIVATKSGPTYPVTLGEVFNYTLSARNNGPLAVIAGQTIRVTDTLPVGTVLASPPSGSGWNCADSDLSSTPPVINCTRLGPLAVGATAPTITVPVQVTTAGTLQNFACTALEGPAVPVDNTANNCTSPISTLATTERADLAIVKTDDSNGDPIRTGDNLTYTLVVTNNGPDISTNVSVADNLTNLLPGAGNGGLQSVTIVPAPAATLGCRIGDSGAYSVALGPLDGGSQNLRCNLGDLASGASSTITIVVKPLVATTAGRTNTATVNSPDVGDGNRANNTSTATTSSVTALVDIQALKTRPSPTIPAGAPLRFTASVRNAGPSTASGVELVDTLPSNAPFLGLISSDGGNCAPLPAIGSVGQPLTCTWASLPNNTTRNVIYEVRAMTEGDTINNAVTVSTTTEENDVLPNTANTTTAVTAALLDIVVNKSDNPNVVALGETSTYTITIDNGGPSAGTGLTVVDTFPVNAPDGSAPTAVFSYQGGLRVYRGVTEVTGDAAEYSCSEPAVGATSGVLTCNFSGYFDEGASHQRRVTYVMRAESVSGVAGVAVGSSHNHVAVAINETETQTDNNEAIETTSARRDDVSVDLGGTKTASPRALVKGENVVYTIAVTNSGGAGGAALDSLGAQLIDSLPAGLQYVSSTPAGACSHSGGTVNCQIGTLPTGANRVFTITARLDESYSGPTPLVNEAHIDAPGDINPGNNNPRDETPVIDKSIGAPTLSQSALLMLTLLMSLLAWRARHRV